MKRKLFFTLFALLLFIFIINIINLNTEILTVKYLITNILLFQNLTTLKPKQPTSTTAITKVLINPELSTYLDFIINPRNLCNSSNKFIFTYAVVNVDDFHKRQIIRQTWANKTYFKNLTTAFIVGLSNETSINHQIKNEQEQFGDLIQGNFLDTYRNLSYKLLTVWKWADIYCSNAIYIARVQDDMFMNTFNMMKFLENENIFFPSYNFKNAKFTFICPPHIGSKPVRDLNSPFNKHYVTHEEYNEQIYNMTKYPTYCSGPAILMTADLAKELFKKSIDVKVFWIEALLARHLEPIYLDAWTKYINSQDIYSKANESYFFIRVDRSVKDFSKVWDILLKKHNRIN